MCNYFIRPLYGLVMLLSFGLLLPTSATAQKGQVTLAADCAADLVKFCRSITPGGSRKIACLISYSDRISPRCRLSAYLAGKVLAENMRRLDALAFQCGADIQSLCYSAGIGGGRIYDCLKKNKARLLPDCRRALPQFEAEYMRK